ncbi:bicoid stability factor [Xylocopa sonorina]|uniref:bicoid stability factor n=1 Tax=Xylocopa sonorina TaxID=1818115 RepID=UPI00403AECB3
MLSIALRCAYNRGHHLKAALRNENKKVTNFVTICSNNSVIVSVRNVMSMAEEEDNVGKYNLIKKKEIENIINHINFTDSIHYRHTVSLLELCCNVTDCLPLDKVNLGKSLWTVLTVCNFKICTGHYNTLLKLYVENEYDFSPSKMLKIMENNNIPADNVTYKMCIDHYCMKGNMKKAHKLLTKMKRIRLPLLKSTFDSMLLGYSLLGKMEDIIEILTSMKEKELQFTTETYVAIMHAYAKTNDINEIKNIIVTCNSRNIYFTNRDILNVIYMLAKEGHIAHIDIMYQYLKKSKQILYNEIQVILKLLSIRQIHVAITALSYMSLNNDHPQCKDILKLILEHMITKISVFSDIVYTCTFFKCEEILKKSLSIALYYSLMTDDKSLLRLLHLFKWHYVIKPHYFWPLLSSHGSKYNLQGILDTLQIMTNTFNVPPCVDTIADYVLPFIFGNVHYMRKLLMKCKIDETTINNAFVLLFLRKRNLRKAMLYIKYFGGKYSYKILALDLRYASICTKDICSFVYISHNLLEDKDFCPTLKENNEAYNTTFSSIDMQLYEAAIDFPRYKHWLKLVMCEIENQNIRLQSETVRVIDKVLYNRATHDLLYPFRSLFFIVKNGYELSDNKSS